jgi:hypothetical protein
MFHDDSFIHSFPYQTKICGKKKSMDMVEKDFYTGYAAAYIKIIIYSNVLL